MALLTDNPVIFKASFYQTIIREILNSAAQGNMMSALLMGLCTIDYMSVPIALPNKNTRTHFKKFLEEYMSKTNDEYLKNEIQDYIYAIRCSMVHVFGESDATEENNIIPQFFIDRVTNDNHLVKNQNENYEERFFVSIPKFIGEIVGSVTEYFRQNDSNLGTIGPDWGKKIYWLGGGGIFNLLTCINGNTIVYKNIHPFLTIIDDKSKTPKEIAEYISDKILTANQY